MHTNLRRLLHTAEGHSQHVVAIFLDVRGFSSFARIAESSDAAQFLTSIYIKLLDDYFRDAAFFKLTGDGMLVLFHYDRATLKDTVRRSVDLSSKILDAFPTITRGDPMINFSVPSQLGVGISRGAATRISSGRKVLDYSGRPLNLAARLMDLARPAGIVLDASLGLDLLTPAVRNRFTQDLVYIRGIAEIDPTPVYILPDQTQLPDEAKRPLSVSRFTEHSEQRTFSEVKKLGSFRHMLTHEPAKTDDIIIHISYPEVGDDGTRGSLSWTPSYKATYAKQEGNPYAKLDYDPVVTDIKNDGITEDDWPVSITIEYSVRGKVAPDPE
jgi:class 3 adenylate cyclase